MVNGKDPRLRNLQTNTTPQDVRLQSRTQRVQITQAKQKAKKLDSEFQKVKSGNLENLKKTLSNLPDNIKQYMSVTEKKLQEQQDKRIDRIKTKIKKVEEQENRAREDYKEARYRTEKRELQKFKSRLEEGEIFDLKKAFDVADDVGRQEERKERAKEQRREARKRQERKRLESLDLPEEGKVRRTNIKTGDKTITGSIDSKGNFSPDAESRKKYEDFKKSTNIKSNKIDFVSKVADSKKISTIASDPSKSLSNKDLERAKNLGLDVNKIKNLDKRSSQFAEETNKILKNKNYNFNSKNLFNKGLNAKEVNALLTLYETRNQGNLEQMKDLSIQQFFQKLDDPNISVDKTSLTQAYKSAVNKNLSDIGASPLKFKEDINQFKSAANVVNDFNKKLRSADLRKTIGERGLAVKDLNLSKGTLNKIITGKALNEKEQTEFWKKSIKKGLVKLNKITEGRLSLQGLINVFAKKGAKNYAEILINRKEAGEKNPLLNDLKNVKTSTINAVKNRDLSKVGVGALKEIGDTLNFILGVKGITIDSKGNSYDGIIAAGGRKLIEYAKETTDAYYKGLNQGIKKQKEDVSSLFTGAKSILKAGGNTVDIVRKYPVETAFLVSAAINAGVISSKQEFLKNPDENIGRALVWLFPGTVVKGIKTIGKGSAILTKKGAKISTTALNTARNVAKAKLQAAKAKSIEQLNKATKQFEEGASKLKGLRKKVKSSSPKTLSASDKKVLLSKFDEYDKTTNPETFKLSATKKPTTKTETPSKQNLNVEKLSAKQKSELETYVREKNQVKNRVSKLKDKKGKSDLDKALKKNELSSLNKLLDELQNKESTILKQKITDSAKISKLTDLQKQIKLTRSKIDLVNNFKKLETRLPVKDLSKLDLLPPKIRDKVNDIVKNLNNLDKLTLAQVGSLRGKIDNLLKQKSIKDFKVESKDVNRVLTKSEQTKKRFDLAKPVDKDFIDNVLTKSNKKNLINDRIKSIDKQISSLRGSLLKDVFLFEDIKKVPLTNSKKFSELLKNLLKNYELNKADRVKIANVEGVIQDLLQRKKQLSSYKDVKTSNLDEKLLAQRQQEFSSAAKKAPILSKKAKEDFTFSVGDLEVVVRYGVKGSLKKDKTGKLSSPISVEVRKKKSNISNNFVKATQKNLNDAVKKDMAINKARDTFDNLKSLSEKTKKFDKLNQQYSKARNPSNYYRGGRPTSAKEMNARKNNINRQFKDLEIVKTNFNKEYINIFDLIKKEKDKISQALKPISERIQKLSQSLKKGEKLPITNVTKLNILLQQRKQLQEQLKDLSTQSEQLQEQRKKVTGEILKQQNNLKNDIIVINKKLPSSPKKTPSAPKGKGKRTGKSKGRGKQDDEKTRRLRIPKYENLPKTSNLRKGYIIRIKEGNKIVAQTTKVLPKNRALSLGAQKVDKEISASFDVVETAKTNIQDLKKQSKLIKDKFTSRRGKDPKVRINVEKKKFRLDSPTEVRSLKKARKKSKKKTSVKRTNTKKSKKSSKTNSKKR